MARRFLRNIVRSFGKSYKDVTASRIKPKILASFVCDDVELADSTGKMRHVDLNAIMEKIVFHESRNIFDILTKEEIEHVRSGMLVLSQRNEDYLARKKIRKMKKVSKRKKIVPTDFSQVIIFNSKEDGSENRSEGIYQNKMETGFTGEDIKRNIQEFKEVLDEGDEIIENKKEKVIDFLGKIGEMSLRLKHTLKYSNVQLEKTELVQKEETRKVLTKAINPILERLDERVKDNSNELMEEEDNRFLDKFFIFKNHSKEKEINQQRRSPVVRELNYDLISVNKGNDKSDGYDEGFRKLRKPNYADKNHSFRKSVYLKNKEKMEFLNQTASLRDFNNDKKFFNFNRINSNLIEERLNNNNQSLKKKDKYNLFSFTRFQRKSARKQ